MVIDVVEVTPPAGEAILITGAWGATAGGGVVGGGVAVKRCTVTVCVATPEALSFAVTVIVLEPTAKGTVAIVQAELPCATPRAPRSVDQLTWIVPVPPVTVPASEILDEVTCVGGG